MENIGKRIDVNGDKGTILYYGPVDGKEGNFYGVDWENPDRGRHDGSFQGKRYFKASGSTSGSFIVPSKASFGRNFKDAFVEQYMIDDNPDQGLKKDVRLARDVEFVKRDKNLNFFSSNKFESLCHVKDLDVCIHKCPITTLSANNCGLDNDSIHLLFYIFPNIQELHLASNEFNKIEIPSNCDNLQELYIYNNKICDFSNLKSLSTLPRLKYLSISNCRLKNVIIDSDGFGALETLVADGNEFTKWEDIQDLGKLKNLRNLTLKCIIPGECGVVTREIIIAKFRNLVELDHCDIAPLERKNSERQFLQGIGVMRPIAKVHYDDVEILAKKHEFIFGDTGVEIIDDFVTIRFRYGDKWFEKEFPLHMDLIRVATLVCRILGGNPRKMEYFYRQSDGIYDARMVTMQPSRTLFSLDLHSESMVIMVDKTDKFVV